MESESSLNFYSHQLLKNRMILQLGSDILEDSNCPPKKRSREDSDGFKLRLKKELMNRDGYR